MFVALEIRPVPPGGIFGGIFNILTLPKVELELREALGARYIAAVTSQSRRGVNWQELEELCSRYRGRILLPEDLRPPEESGIIAPAFPQYRRRLLLDTACELIRRTRMPMYRRIVGLVDMEGWCAGFLETLLQHYTSVRVVTGAVELYEREGRRMMEELGAPVLVSNSLSSLSDCVVVLSPQPYYSREPCILPCPVLAEGVFMLPGPCDQVGGLEPEERADLKEAAPEGISPGLFTAALYEYCRIETVPTVAGTMRYNGKSAGLDEVARHISLRAGYQGIFT